MDVITLKNMDFFGHTGVLPEEKENGQLFTVTAELFFDEIRGAVKTAVTVSKPDAPVDGIFETMQVRIERGR